MPELPEVETIRRNLEAHLRGKTVEMIGEPTHWRSLRYQPGGINQLRQETAGRKIVNVVRRGKFLWLELNEPKTAPGNASVADNSQPAMALCFHLGMSGQLRLTESGSPALRQERIRFGLTENQTLVFCDQRTFGHVEARRLAPTDDGFPAGAGSPRALLPQGLEHIARDVLDPHLDRQKVFEKILTSGRAVKTKLLEQGIVSGIGNIYADEGLFAARIHPATPANRLNQKGVENLLDSVAVVMLRALALGGTSFDELYVNSWGNPGEFAKELQVYGRAGKPCRHCGLPLDKIVIDGRSAVFCSQCEPMPK